jgi:hypothetical protein
MCFYSLLKKEHMRKHYYLHKRKNGRYYVRFVDKATGRVGAGLPCPNMVGGGKTECICDNAKCIEKRA